MSEKKIAIIHACALKNYLLDAYILLYLFWALIQWFWCNLSNFLKLLSYFDKTFSVEMKENNNKDSQNFSFLIKCLLLHEFLLNSNGI